MNFNVRMSDICASKKETNKKKKNKEIRIDLRFANNMKKATLNKGYQNMFKKLELHLNVG